MRTSSASHPPLTSRRRRVVLLLTLFAHGAAFATAPNDATAADAAVTAAQAYRAHHAAAIVREYAAFLRIPNVSRDLPNIERNAQYLEEALRSRGVRTEILRQAGVPPIVWGRLDTPN